MTNNKITNELNELDLEVIKQKLAYQMWEEEGRPEGKSEEHWSQACLVVMSMEESDQSEFPAWLQKLVTEEAALDASTEEAIIEHVSETTVEAIRRRISGRAAA